MATSTKHIILYSITKLYLKNRYKQSNYAFFIKQLINFNLDIDLN